VTVVACPAGIEPANLSLEVSIEQTTLANEKTSYIHSAATNRRVRSVPLEIRYHNHFAELESGERKRVRRSKQFMPCNISGRRERVDIKSGLALSSSGACGLLVHNHS
jgi:hypothetical protein